HAAGECARPAAPREDREGSGAAGDRGDGSRRRIQGCFSLTTPSRFRRREQDRTEDAVPASGQPPAAARQASSAPARDQAPAAGRAAQVLSGLLLAAARAMTT